MPRFLLLFFLLLPGLSGFAHAVPASVPAQQLQQQFQSMQAPLAHSVFQPPLVLTSSERPERVAGDIYGSVHFRFAQLQSVMQSPARWCEVLLLLSNTKRCQVHTDGGTPYLQVHIGGKGEENVGPNAGSRFDFQVGQQAPDFLDVLLSAESGPMGASQIRIHIEGVALTETTSFLHLHYSYDTGWLARTTMGIYLQTLGRGKVGFTPLPGADGTPVRYIEGVRGVIERNVVRYFIGLNCALTHAELRAPQRFPAMAACWYDAEELHPVQLHELERADYLTMKAHEYQAPSP